MFYFGQNKINILLQLYRKKHVSSCLMAHQHTNDQLVPKNILTKSKYL